MATIKNNLELLPRGYKERALRSTDTYVLFNDSVSIDEAIMHFAGWSGTPEGSNFWQDVYYFYKNGCTGNLPKLPDNTVC